MGSSAFESDAFQSDAFDLSGRVAVVTGAGSGIGGGVARVLAGAGATVVCADIDGATAAATCEAITAAGGSASAVATDVARRAEVRDLVQATVAEHGRLDVMCNNAGILIERAVLDLAEDELDRVLAVNLKGVLFGCQEAGAVMRARGTGSIVNMSSGAFDSPPPRMVSYSISKAGIVQLTRTLARELGPDGVRVNAIAPGLVESGITARHFTDEDGTIDDERRQAFYGGMAKMSPLGMVGAPEDIGYAALYLASDAARFVTGQILRPNGGVAMP